MGAKVGAYRYVTVVAVRRVWVARRAHGSGRVFYTALGHREELWQDARFQRNLLGALRWALAP
jgi:type 1 glutamine amidotransferase